MRAVRVLIVDDNNSSRGILREQCEGWQMVPEEAASAAEAMRKLEDSVINGPAYGVLLLDQQMPEMSGLELLRVVRAEADLKEVAVLMMTQADQNAVVGECREMGVSCLIKPVMPGDLMAAMHKALAGPGAAMRERSSAATGEMASVYPLHILLAEDNLTNQRLALVLLGKAGHRVALAETGRQAVNRWREGNFDLILMDIQMPEMDGLEATRQIRGEEKMRSGHTAIVAMTAHAMAEDKARCFAAGMDDYLTKPIERQELLAVLARLGEKRGDANSESSGARTAEPIPIPPAEAREGAIDVAFDKAELLSRLEGDEELLLELIDTFFEESGPLLELVADAVARQDAEALHTAAHKLKGTLHTFGARAAGRTAEALETMGRNRDLQKPAEVLTQLRGQVKALGKELAEWKGEKCPQS
jgi:CheY-like chemotaxis protein/HPt (histidine-containing phosphotransfer) domain-containing protein